MKKRYPVRLRRTINYLQELERELDVAGVDRLTPLINELAAYRNATPLLHAQIEELEKPLNPVRRENAALRRERVQLQDENEALRHDLAQLQAQLDERARTAVEGEPPAEGTAKMPAGGAGTWVKPAEQRATYEIGDRVRIRVGAKTWGGYVFKSDGVDALPWRVVGLSVLGAHHPHHLYSVQVAQPDSLFHVWIKPEDVIEVVT